MSDNSNDFNPLSLVSAPVTGLFNIFGAKKQSDAAENVAKMQTDAARYAADKQSQANADTLAWQQRQAEGNWQNDEVNRKANYNQWAAHEGNVGTIGQYLGLGGKTITPYVPSIDPRYTAPTPAAAANTPGTVGDQLTRPPVNPYYPPGTVGAYLNGAR